jgi:hypothetical protein
MRLRAHGPLGRDAGRLGRAGHTRGRRPAGPSREFGPKALGN